MCQMLCSNCGVQINDRDVVCVKCGCIVAKLSVVSVPLLWGDKQW